MRYRIPFQYRIEAFPVEAVPLAAAIQPFVCYQSAPCSLCRQDWFAYVVRSVCSASAHFPRRVHCAESFAAPAGCRDFCARLSRALTTMVGLTPPSPSDRLRFRCPTLPLREFRGSPKFRTCLYVHATLSDSGGRRPSCLRLRFSLRSVLRRRPYPVGRVSRSGLRWLFSPSASAFFLSKLYCLGAKGSPLRPAHFPVYA